MTTQDSEKKTGSNGMKYRDLKKHIKKSIIMFQYSIDFLGGAISSYGEWF